MVGLACSDRQEVPGAFRREAENARLVIRTETRASTVAALGRVGRQSTGLHGLGRRPVSLGAGARLGSYQLVRQFVGGGNCRWTVAERERQEFGNF